MRVRLLFTANSDKEMPAHPCPACLYVNTFVKMTDGDIVWTIDENGQIRRHEGIYFAIGNTVGILCREVTHDDAIQECKTLRERQN